jgi:hypothetical protein
MSYDAFKADLRALGSTSIPSQAEYEVMRADERLALMSSSYLDPTKASFDRNRKRYPSPATSVEGVTVSASRVLREEASF